jgi:hypothetical protein
MSGACGSSGGFQALDIFVNLLLQLPELLQRPLGKHAEVTRVLRQNFVPIGFQNTLHASHLLNGLVKLFGCFKHNWFSKNAARYHLATES